LVNIFGRRDRAPKGAPITAFWDWWTSEGEARFTNAIIAGQYGDLPNVISAKVAAIHPDLQWETSKGTNSQHLLCVTAAGVPELRPLAERWLRAAVVPGEIWSYAAARQRDPSVLETILEFGGRKIPLALTRVSVEVDEQRQLLHIEVFHPEFATLGDGPSRQVTFLVLDWMLGEDDVTRWLGGIETVVQEPDASIPIEALIEVIGSLADRHTEPVWMLAESTTPAGGRLFVRAKSPLRWIDYPLFDLHSEIRVGYLSEQEDGLPTAGSSEALGVYEDDLIAALSDRALLLAIETSEGHRVFHVYSDSEDQNVRDMIDGLTSKGHGSTTHSLDPGWAQMRKFR
jgi:hypothetical protein